MIKKVLSFLLAILTTIGCVNLTVMAEEKDLIQNGGFEGELASWKTTLNDKTIVNEEAAYDGKKGLKLTAGTKEQYIYQAFEIDRNKCYEISLWVKSEGLTSDEGFYISILTTKSINKNPIGFIFADDGVQADAKRLIKTGGTHGWKKFTYEVDGSDFDVNATSGQVYCYLDGELSGSVCVDNVSFKEKEFAVVPNYERFGNVLLKSEKIGIPLKTYNNRNVNTKLNVSYQVMDDQHSPVISGTDSYEAKANTTSEYFVEIPIEKLGQFNYHMQITSEDNSVDITIKDSFCVVMQDNSENTLDDYGVCDSLSRRLINQGSVPEVTGASDLMGAGVRRDEIRWEEVEKKKGVYALTESHRNTWSETLKVGNKAVVLLAFSNVLYDVENIAVVPTTEAQLEGWRNYCAYVVSAVKDLGYKDDEVIFEVWNEFSGGAFNATAVPDSHYVNLLKIAYEEVKKVMPEAVVVIEGMAHVYDGKGVERFTTYCETGVLNYCDAINFHPYVRPEQPDDRDLYERIVEDFRGLMKQYGYEDRPIIMTELGINTSAGVNYGQYSIREQAISVIRYYVMNKMTQKKYGQKDIMIWYKGWEANYTIATEQFGLIEAPWNEEVSGARLGFASYNALATLMNRSEYVEGNDDGNVKIHKLRHESGKDMMVMWTSKDSEEISIKCNGTPEVYDMAGSSLDVPVHNGEFSLTLTREPVFVIGNLPTTDYRAGDITLKVKEGTSYKGDTFKVTVVGNPKYQDKEMTVIPVLPDGWSWKNQDIRMAGNGEYELEFFASDDNFGNSMNPVVLNVAVDGKNVTRLEYRQEVLIPVDSEATRISVEEDGKLCDIVKIAVSNKSKNSDVTGYLAVTGPIEFVSGNERHPINVKAGETSYIYIPVEKYPDMGYHTLEYDIYTDGVSEPIHYSKLINYLNVAYAKTKPQIDGIIGNDEWAASKAVNIVNPVFLGAAEATDPIPPDTEGTMYTMWDEDNLYIGAVVKDDKHFNDNVAGKLWAADSLQVSVDTKHEDLDDTGWVEYTVALTDTGKLKEQDRLFPYQSETLNPPISFDVTRNEAKCETVYEIAIPWSESVHKDSMFDPEGKLAMSLAINDHDGLVRKGYTHYMLGIVDSKDKRKFGDMYLLDNPKKISEITLAVNNSKALIDDRKCYVDSDNQEVTPIIRNDRTLVPARFISEKFGADVRWNEKTKEVTIVKANTTLKFTVDSEIYYINDTKFQMDTKAIIHEGRTMLPLRVIAEGLGKYVYWQDLGIIIISSDFKNYSETEVKQKLSDIKE